MVKAIKESKKNKVIRIGCTPAFYERANRVAEAKGFSLSDFGKMAIETQIGNYEQLHGPMNKIFGE